jgi:23S rRNA (cytidine1920-2'-O)/16S rRNA (cytidine1409-2'-O)-methyltransferase
VPRLDQLIVDRALLPTRSKAQAAILAGQVLVNGQPASKPGTHVSADAVVQVVAGDRYVSRGGHKLEHGLVHFGVAVSGTRCLDVGASTGGFTDCLLQHGAGRVHAVDVGHGQLAWKLRTDPRVVVMERVNARLLTPASFAAGTLPFRIAVVDCSFISLRKVLPVLPPLLGPGADVVALVKPQFEAGKAEADRGAGVITDPEIHRRVLSELEGFVGGAPLGLEWLGVVESPLLGPAGNREFLAHLRRTP